MAIDKDTFLTIPEAPNYEVNGHFVVRNAKTKRVIQPIKKGHEAGVVYLNQHGYRPRRRPEAFYRLACAEIDAECWRPVPSLGGRYELNSRGDLRNTATKSPLKKYAVRQSHAYKVTCGHYVKKVTAEQLMNEVYGTKLAIRTRDHRGIGVQLSNGNERHDFNSITECAEFLATNVFYSAGTICHQMVERPSKLWEWDVTYLERKKIEQPQHNTS